MIALLVSTIFSIVSSQANYICGVEGNQYFSQYPCTNYPQTCVNGGFKLFVGCQNDYTCALYSPSAVCIAQCCCSPPIGAAPPYPYDTLFQDEATTLSLIPSLLLVSFIALLGLH